MAFFSHALPITDALPATARAKRGLWARFLAAMMESRQRQADREIAIYLHRTGGRLTDTVEREIERRFLSNHRGQRWPR